MVKQQILVLILSSFIFSMGHSQENSSKARVSDANNVAVGHRQLQSLINLIYSKAQLYLPAKGKDSSYFNEDEMKNYREQIVRIKVYIEKIPSAETFSKSNSAQERAEKKRKILRDAVLLLEKRFSDFDDRGYSKTTGKHISNYPWEQWRSDIFTLSEPKVTGAPIERIKELLRLICDDQSYWDEHSFDGHLEKVKKQFEEWELILNTTEEQQKVVSDFQFIKKYNGSYNKDLIEEKNKNCKNLENSSRKSNSQPTKLPSQSKPPPQ